MQSLTAKKLIVSVLLLALAGGMLLGAGGCGKKGPLYLEDDDKKEQNKPS